MITATPKEGFFQGREVEVHGLVNRGGFSGETWLAVISIANNLHAAIVIEAHDAGEALDELADSPTWAHLIGAEECWQCETKEPYCDCDDQTFAGNDGHRISTDYLSLLVRCNVKYFEPAD